MICAPCEDERAADLRVAEGLVTDGDAEGGSGGGEHPAAGASDVVGILGGIDLRLHLLPEARSISVDDHGDDLEPARVGRSAPTIVTTPASREARAIALSASSRAAAVTFGTGRVWHRCPGRPVSGRQTIRAPRRPASRTAAIAAGVASLRVVVSGVDATAMRVVAMRGI